MHIVLLASNDLHSTSPLSLRFRKKTVSWANMCWACAGPQKAWPGMKRCREQFTQRQLWASSSVLCVYVCTSACLFRVVAIPWPRLRLLQPMGMRFTDVYVHGAMHRRCTGSLIKGGGALMQKCSLCL